MTRLDQIDITTTADKRELIRAAPSRAVDADPPLPESDWRVRNRKIADKFVKGKSLRQLALEFSMTERTVVKILSMTGTTGVAGQASFF